MRFSKLSNGSYRATRKDGQVITISKIEEPWGKDKWVSRYENDWDGDNTWSAPTKKEIVDQENWVESNL